MPFLYNILISDMTRPETQMTNNDWAILVRNPNRQLTNSTSRSWHPDLVGGLPAGPTLTLWPQMFLSPKFDKNLVLQLSKSIQGDLVAITVPCSAESKPAANIIVSIIFLLRRIHIWNKYHYQHCFLPQRIQICNRHHCQRWCHHILSFDINQREFMDGVEII